MAFGAPNANGDALAPELLFETNPLPNPLDPEAVLLPNTLVDCPLAVFPKPLDIPAPTFPNPLEVGAAAGFPSPPNENALPAGFALDAPLGLNENPVAAGFGAGALNSEEPGAVVVAGAADEAAAGVGVNENPPIGFVAAGLGAAGVAPKGEGAGAAGAAPPKGVVPKGVLVAAGTESAGLGVFDCAANANGEGLVAAVEVGAPKGETVAGAVGAAVELRAPKGEAVAAGAGAGLGFTPNPGVLDTLVVGWGANSEGAVVVAVVAARAGAGVAENKGLGASSFFGAAKENGFAAAGALIGAGAGVGSTGLGAGAARLKSDGFAAGCSVAWGVGDSVLGAVRMIAGTGAGLGTGAGVGAGAGAGADLAASAALRSLKIFNALASRSCFSQVGISLLEFIDVAGSVPIL